MVNLTSYSYAIPQASSLVLMLMPNLPYRFLPVFQFAAVAWPLGMSSKLGFYISAEAKPIVKESDSERTITLRQPAIYMQELGLWISHSRLAALLIASNFEKNNSVESRATLPSC